MNEQAWQEGFILPICGLQSQRWFFDFIQYFGGNFKDMLQFYNPIPFVFPSILAVLVPTTVTIYY